MLTGPLLNLRAWEFKSLPRQIAEVGGTKSSYPMWRSAMLSTLAGVFVGKRDADLVRVGVPVRKGQPPLASGMGAWLAISVGGQVPGLATANPGLQVGADGRALSGSLLLSKPGRPLPLLSSPSLQKLLYGVFGFPMGLTIIQVLGAEVGARLPRALAEILLTRTPAFPPQLFTSNTAYMVIALYEASLGGFAQHQRSAARSLVARAPGRALLIAGEDHREPGADELGDKLGIQLGRCGRARHADQGSR